MRRGKIRRFWCCATGGKVTGNEGFLRGHYHRNGFFQGLHSYMHNSLPLDFLFLAVGIGERVKVTLLPFPLGKCPHLDVFIRYWNSSVCNSDQLSIQRQSLEFKTDFPTYRQFFFIDFHRSNKSAKKLVVAFSSALLLLLQLVPMHLQTALNGFLTQFLLVFNDLEENTYA